MKTARDLEFYQPRCSMGQVHHELANDGKLIHGEIDEALLNAEFDAVQDYSNYSPFDCMARQTKAPLRREWETFLRGYLNRHRRGDLFC